MARVELIAVEHALLVEEGPAALARASRPALDFEPLRALVGRLLALPGVVDPQRAAEVQARIAKLEAHGAPSAVLEPQRRTLAALTGQGRDPARVEGASPHDLRRWLVESALHERAAWDVELEGALLAWVAELATPPLAWALGGAEPAPEAVRPRPGDRYNPPAAVRAIEAALGALDPAAWTARLAALGTLAPDARPAGASGDPERDLALATLQLTTLRHAYGVCAQEGQGLLVRLR